MPPTPNVDPEFQAKLDELSKNSPVNRAVRAAEQAQQSVSNLEQRMAQFQPQMGLKFDNLAEFVQPIVQGLSEVKAALASNNDAKADAQLVKQLQTFTKSVTDGLNNISLPTPEVKADFTPNIQVSAPDVTVQAPTIDLAPISQLIKKDLPLQLETIINNLPEATDTSGIEERLDKAVTALKDIQISSRMKPQFPTSLGISNQALTDLDLAINNTNRHVIIGTTHKKFRDGFASPFVSGVPDPAVWTLNNTDGHIISQGGNSSGSAYLRISLNPTLDDSEVTLTSKDYFQIPFRTGFGLSISQRISGQEVYVGVVGDDGTGTGIDTSTTVIADQAITGNISVTTNVGTVTLANHGYTGGDRISIYSVADSRMNVGPVVVTVIDQNNFTVPIVAPNGTYTGTGGYIRYADPFRWAYNGAGYLFENTTVTNASLVLRRNGARFRSLNAATTTTTATQTNTSPFTDAFNSAGNLETYLSLEEVDFRSFSSDSVAAMTGYGKFTQSVPDENPNYHLHIRARNLKGLTKVIARITAIAKTGTTTATVTTDVAHGLTTADFVQIYGALDQVNFPNLTVATAVASVIDTTHFTVVIGSATTTSSLGGAIWRVQGGVLAPGAYTQVVQSLSVTSNIMTVIGNGTWATPLPGEYVYLYGMQNGAGTYDGAYKVLKVNTTSLILAAPGVADFTSITTGGAAIRMTDVRLHFTRLLDYTRTVTEVVGGKGNTNDINNSVPVSVTASATVPVSQSTGVNTTQWSAAGWGGFLVIDVASAALTVTTTTAAVIPGTVATIGTYAHAFNVIVTAVSGTTPTLDVGVEESIDNGVNWVRIYDFERITATGAYTSPQIRAQYGTRYRYVQTVTGTTPSFTRAVNRVMFSVLGQLIRRFLDRTIVLTTLSSVTPTYNVEGCDFLELVVAVGAVTTTAPVIQLEGSETGIAAEFYAIGTPVTAVASTAVRSVYSNELPKFVRARVSTAGVGVTANYVAIKALGR